MKHIIDTDELEAELQSAYRLDDLITAIRTLVANSPQADGMANSRDMFEQFATLHNMPVLKVGEAYSNDDTNYAWWVWKKALSTTAQVDGRMVNADALIKAFENDIAKYDNIPNLHSAIAIVKAMLSAYKPQADDSLQQRVKNWMQECFGEVIANDKLERGDRFLEENLELLQSGGYPRERIPALVEYVYNRPIGEPSQEVGGVMITLAAYCLAHGLDMHQAGETELARINQPAIIEKIRAKQAKKAAENPFSPLPQADDVRKDAERWRTFREIASEEICFALCGNSNADNDELDQAVDKLRE